MPNSPWGGPKKIHPYRFFLLRAAKAISCEECLTAECFGSGKKNLG